MTDPLVSIVLVTRNGAGTLPALLDAIARQRVAFPFEIVAVDSGSTDGTLELLRARADRLITIAADQFDHGLTRNLAIRQSRGAHVVLLVQDAEPASDTWLTQLVAPLLEDTSVAGAFARQAPRPEASAITRHYHARWVAAATTARSVAIEARRFEGLEPMAQFEHCAFDNVCSCIRRTVWEKHPFRSTPMAEDIEWAREVLLSGHRLVFASQALVIHSHDRSARYELARTYILHRRLYELFRLRTVPSLRSLVGAIGSSIALHWRCWRGRTLRDSPLDTASRAMALAVVWPLGQYLGGLAGVRGWKTHRSRLV
jgi:rhamnosyltransferase